jgi:hypothetical protein
VGQAQELGAYSEEQKVQNMTICLYGLNEWSWAGYAARMGDRRSVYRALVGKPESRRLLGKLRHRWKDNIKTHPTEVGWSMDSIDLAQDRDKWRTLVNAVMNLRVP